ncbi:DUF799 domain-containing protein [Bordetella sp. 15P40C-2]|uniref:DUF799 domain-containing protein n=1 Tax=Bordetella sp. 15P40C-2 TaxID=2572246 RepID=UPI00351BE5E7
MMKFLSRGILVGMVLTLGGCAVAHSDVNYDAFRESKPASLLVLPPVNHSVEPGAAAAVLAQVTYPLAESGYYVVPVGVMEETFRQNGMMAAEEAHAVPAAKLREIFGADAALYMTVKQYGSTYKVVSSMITVELEASLVDLRSGANLWRGATTVVHGGDNNNNNSLIGMLVGAMVAQIANTLSDRSYDVAGMADTQLLYAGRPGGMLFGPRSPHYSLQ